LKNQVLLKIEKEEQESESTETLLDHLNTFRRDYWNQLDDKTKNLPVPFYKVSTHMFAMEQRKRILDDDEQSPNSKKSRNSEDEEISD
jgi:hypothetical protein